METEMEEWKDSSRTARERETFAAKGPTRGRELYPGSHWFVSVTAKLDWGRNRQARRGANWLAQRPGLWILLIGRPSGTVILLVNSMAMHPVFILEATSQFSLLLNAHSMIPHLLLQITPRVFTALPMMACRIDSE